MKKSIQQGSVKDIEGDLSAKILLMLAGNFERWDTRNDNEWNKSVMSSAGLMSQGIAEKLAEALAVNTCELHADRWQELVNVATRNAFMEYGDGGVLLTMRENKTFSFAVAQCTACVVAPVGSSWAFEIEARAEQRIREMFTTSGLKPKEVERRVQKWRASEGLMG